MCIRDRNYRLQVNYVRCQAQRNPRRHYSRPPTVNMHGNQTRNSDQQQRENDNRPAQRNNNEEEPRSGNRDQGRDITYGNDYRYEVQRGRNNENAQTTGDYDCMPFSNDPVENWRIAYNKRNPPELWIPSRRNDNQSNTNQVERQGDHEEEPSPDRWNE